MAKSNVKKVSQKGVIKTQTAIARKGIMTLSAPKGNNKKSK